MGSLQLALAVLGGLVLAAVIAYNTISEHRQRPRTVDAKRGGQESGSQNREPELGLGVAGFSLAEERTEPVLDGGGAVAASAVPRAAVAAGFPGQLQHATDALVPIALDGRIVDGVTVLAAMPTTCRAGGKPYLIEAQAEGGSGWEQPVGGQRYQALRAGVLLANRRGALNEIEFSEFIIKLQQFADAIGAELEIPDMATEVARARELDDFASGHDAGLEFFIRTNHSPWSPGFVIQHATDLGFVQERVPGRMGWPSDDGQEIVLELNLGDGVTELDDELMGHSIRQVSLSFDVPRVPAEQAPYVLLCQLSEQLAQRLGGWVTDDSGRALEPAFLDEIGIDVGQLYAELEDAGLAAGSAAALRVFN